MGKTLPDPFATGRTTGVIEMLQNAMSFDFSRKRLDMVKVVYMNACSAWLNSLLTLVAHSSRHIGIFCEVFPHVIHFDTAGHGIHIGKGFDMGIAPSGYFTV